MAELKRDANYKTVTGGVNSSDNVTVLPFRVDPVTNRLLLSVTSDSLTPTAATSDKRDQNHVPTVYGISSVDGVTLVPIRTDTSGNLLIQFN